MTRTCSCQPWRLGDTAAMLRAAAAATPTFRLDSTHLVILDLADAIVGVREMSRREAANEYDDRLRDVFHDAAADVLGELSGPRPPIHVAHVVRCRPGRAVFGIDDYRWCTAMLYGLNLIDAYCGEVIVVTPYGWTTGPRRAGQTIPTTDDLVRVSTVRPIRPALPPPSSSP